MINLRKARINKDLSRLELSKLVGCSIYMIDSLESGRSKGSVELLTKLANELKVSMDYLIGRKSHGKM